MKLRIVIEISCAKQIKCIFVITPEIDELRIFMHVKNLKPEYRFVLPTKYYSDYCFTLVLFRIVSRIMCFLYIFSYFTIII